MDEFIVTIGTGVFKKSISLKEVKISCNSKDRILDTTLDVFLKTIIDRVTALEKKK